MKPLLHLPIEAPNSLNLYTEDVERLVREHNWDKLNQVPVCIDQHQILRAHFGQNRWDCSHMPRIKAVIKTKENLISLI